MGNFCPGSGSFTVRHEQSPISTKALPAVRGGQNPEKKKAVPPSGKIVTPNLKMFTLAELKTVTKNFRPGSVIGEGGFGKVFKGWVDEKSLAPSRAGVGIPVAVKKSNPHSEQGLHEWQEARGMHWKAWQYLSRPKAEGGIGFRDLEAFNLALLGKQLWRMLTHEHTLLARVFKARYFSKTDPLRATLGSRPSYAWRSIHAAQELIKQGTRLVIGNGEATEIWQQQWIDAKPARAILKTRKVDAQIQGMLSSVSKVKDLLDASGREWRYDVLEQLFFEDDRESIEKIRPGGKNTKDSYAWDYAKSGEYTVKSGYWVQTQIINTRTVPREVNQPSLNPLFQQLWKLQASPKVLHFIWKCLSNCLSVAGNLAYRHLSREANCPRCPEKMETVNHLLFQCTFARLVWAISPVPAPPEGEWSDSIYSNLHRVFNMGKDNPNLTKAAQLAPWLLWRLWKNRNELIFNGKEFDAREVLRRAMEDAEEWERRKAAENNEDNHPGPRKTEPRENVKWQRPPPGYVKCNTDAAWQKAGDKCGLGWVLRDHTGHVRWLGARALPRLRTVIETEMEALRWAVRTMCSFNYKKIIFESDAQDLIKLLNSGEGWPHLNPSIQDIRNMLPFFEDVKFEFKPRGGNKVADRIARESISFENYGPKLYSIVPSWLRTTVDLDVVM